MQSVTSARILSFKTLILTAITLIVLGASAASAKSAVQKPLPQPSGNEYNWTGGGLC